MKTKIKYILLCFTIFLSLTGLNRKTVFAQDDIIPLPNLQINIGGPDEEGAQSSSSVQLLFLVTIIALAPSILIMLTCFTRIIIVLHFIRAALGTQQMPPNQILIGLALFLTFFIMNPVLSEVNETAIKPFSAGEMTQSEMIETGMGPIRNFMFAQVADKDLALFSDLAQEEYGTLEEIPNRVLIPAFILGEISKGFVFGFFIYIPFIVIDMIVASILMAMGMMMLPPAMISLPFKILLFILVDGWSYIIEVLARTFY